MKLDYRNLLSRLGVIPLSNMPAEEFLKRIAEEQNKRSADRRQAQRARAGKRLDVQILTDVELDVLLEKARVKRDKLRFATLRKKFAKRRKNG